MPIEKIVVCWILGLNFLEDPDTDSLYILIFNLTLIYLTLNLNLFFTIIYVLFTHLLTDNGYDGGRYEPKESG